MTCAPDLSRLTMRHFRYQIRWFWSGSEDRALTLTTRVPDRDTGKEIRVSMAQIDVFGLQVEQHAFRMLTEFARHEADECFYVDGQRFIDPHAQGPGDAPHPLAWLSPIDSTPRAPQELRDFVSAFLPRVEVKHLRYPIRWCVTAPGVWSVKVSLIAEVDGRDDGRFGEILMHREVHGNVTSTGIAWVMLGLLREFMAHEAAEAFHVDGVRVFDPHKSPHPPQDQYV